MSIHPDPQINRLNVLGEPLASCCFDPITGYFGMVLPYSRNRSWSTYGVRPNDF